jgi:quinone-modifying oxidoreductase subunit QmoA
VTFETLIIGGGIAGITAAVELAEAGRQVVLVEKEPYLGGNVSRFNNYFPKLCPPSCGLEINFARIRSNPRITYYTGAGVQSICGSEGDFTVTIGLEPRLINNLCTSCGLCAEVCPVERSPEPGRPEGQKAAYIRSGLAFPLKYSIDAGICLKEECGKCLEVCEFEAIQLGATPAVIKLRADRIIVATGWSLYDPGKLVNYRYSEEADVVSNLEFEQMLASCTRESKELARPSDGSLPRRIAFVQCAGSRDVNHLPYCSAVCCSVSLKHALNLESMYPDIYSEIFYIDIRLGGRNEKLLKEAEGKKGIGLTKGKVGRISKEKGSERLLVEVEDIQQRIRRVDAFDLVVLAMGLVPNGVQADLQVNEFGFFLPDQLPGIVPAASCKRPMDVSSAVKDATASAMKSLHR